MKTLTSRLHLYPKFINSIPNSSLFIHKFNSIPIQKHPFSRISSISRKTQEEIKIQKSHDEKKPQIREKQKNQCTNHHDFHPKLMKFSKLVKNRKTQKGEFSIPGGDIAMVGAVSVGLMVLFMALDDGKALALGPEGPLVEEFWDNVRRYALYALTVSTGALYSVVEPILELLKNPISAVLVVVILVGTFFIGSQILSAMVGINEFSYDYAY